MLTFTCSVYAHTHLAAHSHIGDVTFRHTAMAQISGRDNLFSTLLMLFELCSGLDFEVQALVWCQVLLGSVPALHRESVCRTWAGDTVLKRQVPGAYGRKG